ncbi:radical SAM protein [Paractinoplanes durhamensis]|uniref:radical SAM protein n=1 Tax=Paractinoplanes durhamensis TaxID=113563 RepID=UPI0036383E02
MTGAVVLVSMPFADGPSLQLGLLKPAVAAAGFPVRTLHAGLDLAARIGMPAYRQLAAHRGRMFGDWLFSVQAFGSAAPDPDGLMVSRFAADAPDLDLMKIRDAVVPEYLDALAADPVFDDATVVGFTSTFQQNVASFALARRLKARFPSLVTVFGGANFDPPMGAEYLRAMDCVDHVVSGPGEVALPELLGGTASGSAFPPDYDEYFERAERLGLLDREKVRLPFESSRGCWWGAKHHCTFCGLNGTTMAYRSKPPEQVLAELAGLARRYRTFRFDAVDNILDPAYLKTVMPALTESGYDLFYEVKANLGRAQLRLLAQAGVRRLQPGLESLSTRVLGLMRKGCGPRRTSTCCGGRATTTSTWPGICCGVSPVRPLRITARRPSSSRTWFTCSHPARPTGSGWSDSARCSRRPCHLRRNPAIATFIRRRSTCRKPPTSSTGPTTCPRTRNCASALSPGRTDGVPARPSPIAGFPASCRSGTGAAMMAPTRFPTPWPASTRPAPNAHGPPSPWLANWLCRKRPFARRSRRWLTAA